MLLQGPQGWAKMTLINGSASTLAQASEVQAMQCISAMQQMLADYALEVCLRITVHWCTEAVATIKAQIVPWTSVQPTGAH